jgi:polysaccharide chain length determinant protein (PEP-CTERM system associated)
MNVEQGFQLKDVRALLRRRWKTIAVVTGALALFTIFVSAVLPNRYEAWTTLLIEGQTISKELVEAGLEGSDLNNRLHLMTMRILSRPRLSKVIDELGLYAAESEEMTREEVIELMRDDIRVEPVLPELDQSAVRRRDLEINTFRLYFLHESPQMAANVANRLSQDFIDEHIKERVQISGDTSDFINNELERLQGRIQAVEGRIAQVKAENPGRLPDDMAANQRVLERAISDQRFAQRDLAEARSDEAFFQQQALLGGNTEELGAVVTSPARKLSLLELQLAELKGKGFTEKHPDIISVQSEIEQVKGQLAVGEGEEDKGGSAAQLQAEAEARRAGLRAAGAQEEIDRLQATIADYEQRITETPRVAEQLTGLEREYEHLFKSYQEFSDKRLAAGVAADMERRQKGEQFRILESAFAPPEPASPNRPLLWVLGAIFGLAVGVGAGFLLEASDASFHAARDLQAALRIPVLATIPGIWLDSDRARRRRRALVQGFAAVAVSTLVLMSSGVGYLLVNGVPGASPAGPAAPVAPTPAAPAPAAPAAPAAPPGAAAPAAPALDVGDN